MAPRLSENERAALRAVRSARICAQSALPDQLAITQQSVSRIVSSLQQSGLVNVGSPSSNGKRGKPSPMLSLNPQSVYSVGISIMADSLSIGVFDFEGKRVGWQTRPMPGMAVDHVISEIDRSLAGIVQDHELEFSKICGAGVAMTGYFMGAERKFNPPAPLRHWFDLEIDKLVADKLGIPVWSDNDGNIAAIGEAALGSGSKFKNFAYLYFSAGFGGGVVTQGRLLRGRFGNAGEFAGILPPTIETHPNLENLRRAVARHGKAYETIHDMVLDLEASHPGVEEWIEEVREGLNLVCSACSAILDAEAIIFGGLIPTAIATKLIERTEFFSKARWGRRRPVPELLLASPLEDAVLLGAATLPMEELYF